MRSWTTKLFAAALAITSLGISGGSVSGAEGADQPEANTLFQYSIHPSKEIASAAEGIWIRNVLTNTSGHIISGCINPYLGYEFQQQDRTSLEHQRVAFDLDCMEGGKFRLAQGERFTWREKVIIPDWSTGPLTITTRTSMSLWQPLGIRDTEPGSVDLFATATIKIVEHCTLNILVQDNQGPLPGARVLLFHQKDEPIESYADKDGLVAFTSLPVSSAYRVGAQFPGYQTVTKRTECPSSSDNPIVLWLLVPAAQWEFPPTPKPRAQPLEVGNLPDTKPERKLNNPLPCG